MQHAPSLLRQSSAEIESQTPDCTLSHPQSCESLRVMRMAHHPCLTSLRLFGVVLAALLVNSAFLIWIYSKKGDAQSGMGGGRIDDLAKTTCFLKAIDSEQKSTEIGELEWEERERDPFSLTKNRTHIKVTKAGWYLVFVQATFKLPPGNNTKNLRLQLNFCYPERIDQLASAFDTRQLLKEEQDAHLSFPVIVQMKEGNGLSVLANHRDLIDYELKPMSTFITIIRLSD
ncbi:uncharacterized protein si:dkey-220k22.3 [Esox lucius]|uniref:uncharacterized protein si:dkey-220k22.3 n=1 Tax=Esox lucius TaxID=8010 RepID=UPI0005761366|nr:uncharacterized protein si:dkey-220k22.3 [Esox lucius]